MRAPAALNLTYVSRADQAARADDVLGIATFNGTRAPAAGVAGIPIVRVNTPVLAGEPTLYEVWSSGRSAESGQMGPVRFRHSADLLFGCVTVAEQDFAVAGPWQGEPSALHRATAYAYREICATLETQEYPQLLRIWNYLPDINGDSHGTERYRQFNAARQHALQACGRAVAGSVPAASALGSASESPLVVYFLAGRVAPVFVENPRQVSAYHYPQEYGTHSPVFSRAALLRQAESLTLFISGTASIVGHRSLHIGDTAAQTRESLNNIEALLSEANRLAGEAHFDLAALAYKVYARRPGDLAVIQAQLALRLGLKPQIIYLQADICRQDLLVEIEATGICPLVAAA